MDAFDSLYEPSCDVANFAEYADLASTLRSRAEAWWSAWVSPELGVPAPTLRLQVRDVGDAFYGASEHAIYLYLVDGDIEDVSNEAIREQMGMAASGRAKGITWAAITGQLLHELMDAFQQKVLREPTPDGITLAKCPPKQFPGGGHDERFCSAIAMVSPYFGLTAEEFAREL